MHDLVDIRIKIPRATWETIQRSTRELQERARGQGMAAAMFDPSVHAAMLLQQAVDMADAGRKRR
jgi:hypothetical protein